MKAGEIVGVACVSSNGQVELVEVLASQRQPDAGTITVHGKPYGASRAEVHVFNARYLPEEPLRNACAPRMSLAENLFVRGFDIVASNGRRRFWLDAKGMRTLAQQLMDEFSIETASINSRIESLYGGNVHRAVLARELTGEVGLLVISNRYCALDFAAVREIRRRIVASPNAGAAVLLMSEDLDELLEIAGRIVVLSAEATAYETPVADAEIGCIGRHA